MNLWYIHIEPNRELYGNEYGYEFLLRTRFISNFLSKKIRKYRFRTDGTFTQISIKLEEGRKRPEGVVVPFNSLRVAIDFDRASYEAAKDADDFEYYLSLYEAGFRAAAGFKEIPLSVLLNLLGEFRQLGYKNEWLYKKKSFPGDDVTVALNCYFTTHEFRLEAVIGQISTKKELCRGELLKTDPDEHAFDPLFKDIELQDGEILILSLWKKPEFRIDLSAARAGELRFESTNSFSSARIENVLKETG